MNHYDVLGLVPSVEQSVIRAAYKALVNIYHPDKHPVEGTEEVIKKINVAYEILSNPQKKKEYDKEIEISKNTANKFSFSTKASFDTELLDNKWSLAIDFYPVILKEYNFLKNISWNLAYSFKLELIESKDYSNSTQLFFNKKLKYLSLYFGSDNDTLDYAEKLILMKEIDAALELNLMIETMGKSVSKVQLENAIDNKYPKLSGKISYLELKEQKGNDLFAYAARNDLLKAHNAVIKNKGFFTDKLFISINNQDYEFVSTASLDEFLIEFFAGEYEC